MRKPSGQRGFTLVELMIGMTLSMVTMLGVLNAYKAVVMHAQTSAKSAQLKSASASLSIIFPRMAQPAGWGVGVDLKVPGGAANTDVVLLQNATFTNGQLAGTATPISATLATGNALVWNSSIAGATNCSGVAVINGAILRMGPVACTNAMQWGALNWGARQHIAQDESFPTAAVTAVKTACWPYGGGPGPQPAVMATIKDAGTTAASVCMNNISN